MRSVRRLLSGGIVLALLARPVHAQEEAHRLTARDATLLRRYLPVMLRDHETSERALQADLAVSDGFLAWRDSVRSGRLDLAAMLGRRYGHIPLPDDVALDTRCSLQGMDGALHGAVTYRLRQRLPAVARATDGVLSSLGGETQTLVGVARRNVPIAERWRAELVASGYVRAVSTDFGEEYFRRVVSADTITVMVHEQYPCGVDEPQDRIEPAVTVEISVRELQVGAPVRDRTVPTDLPTMYAQDGLTEDALTAVLTSASVAYRDTQQGRRPSAEVPSDLQTPEMRSWFAIREANMRWLAEQDPALVDLIGRYLVAVR